VIKALLLIFSPLPTWERVVARQRSWVFVFLCNTLPLLLGVLALEGYALTRWGKPRGEITHVKQFTVAEAVIFEALQLLLTLGVLFLAVSIVRNLCRTFRGGRPFTPVFTLVAYGLSPVFLFHVLDVFPSIWPWLSWVIGICVSAAVLYNGIPPVIEPDPPQAFGFYLSTILLLTFLTGLPRLVTGAYVLGKFPEIESFISKLAAQM